MGYFTNLLVQTAVLKVTGGTDSNGNLKISSEVEIKCKIEFGNSIVTSSKGQELTSSGRLFTENSAKVGDLLKIGDDEYLIVKVTPSFALDCVSVLNEIYFQ